MILSANQPYFLPHLAYWQLIDVADLFLVGDDYSYIRHGWINRNRIMIGGEYHFISLSIRSKHTGDLVNHLSFMPIDQAGMLKTMWHVYRHAPHFEEGYALMQKILSCPELGVADFLASSIADVCKYLGINTPIGRTSQYANFGVLKREDRIYDYCRRIGADTYVNPIGGRALYDKVSFAAQGIDLKFLNSPYAGGPSIIDVIMNNSLERIREMLNDYEYV